MALVADTALNHHSLTHSLLVCCSTKVETYKWPNVPDKVWVEKTKILMKIPEPKSSGSQRHVFTITGQEIDRRSI